MTISRLFRMTTLSGLLTVALSGCYYQLEYSDGNTVWSTSVNMPADPYASGAGATQGATQEPGEGTYVVIEGMQFYLPAGFSATPEFLPGPTFEYYFEAVDEYDFPLSEIFVAGILEGESSAEYVMATYADQWINDLAVIGPDGSGDTVRTAADGTTRVYTRRFEIPGSGPVEGYVGVAQLGDKVGAIIFVNSETDPAAWDSLAASLSPAR